MGASGYGDRIELIVDICEFYERVGMVAPYTALERLGLATRRNDLTARSR